MKNLFIKIALLDSDSETSFMTMFWTVVAFASLPFISLDFSWLSFIANIAIFIVFAGTAASLMMPVVWIRRWLISRSPRLMERILIAKHGTR